MPRVHPSYRKTNVWYNENMWKERRKDIFPAVLAAVALLLTALLFPAGGAMASETHPQRIAGTAKDLVALTPEESLQIPFRPEMELLTELSIYFVHFPEEEAGDFFVAVRDEEGQILFETKRPLAELPHEDFGRFPVGITLDPERSYVCEVSHSGASPEPGVRLVVMDEKPAWFRAGAIRKDGTEIQDAVLMNMMYFRPRVFYLLILKVVLMAAAMCGIVYWSVRLCRGEAS